MIRASAAFQVRRRRVPGRACPLASCTTPMICVSPQLVKVCSTSPANVAPLVTTVAVGSGVAVVVAVASANDGVPVGVGVADGLVALGVPCAGDGVAVAVVADVAALAVLQLSTSPALSPTRTLFAANATSAALDTFDCSRIADF